MVSMEEKYFELVRKYPQKYPGPNEPFEPNFEFNSLSYSVYRRFIELLYPITNHFFKNTSKENYQQCLDLRGIEVEDLDCSDFNGPHGELSFKSGKMDLNLDKVPTNWTKLLVVTGVIDISYPRHGAVPDMKKLDFVKRYKKLNFYRGFAEQLEYLIHPTLERVHVNGQFFKFDKLSSFLDKLNVCHQLEYISFRNDYVESAAAFKKLKQQLEQHAKRHPDADVSCYLGDKNYFKIHENVLCHCPKRNVLVKNYTFEDLSQ